MRTYPGLPGPRVTEHLSLTACADLPALVIDATGATEIGPDLIPDVAGARAVLVRTGWDRHWGTETYGSPAHPHLSTAAGEALVRAGVGLVGIDTVNVDSTTGADVLVVENLTRLDDLPERGPRFTAVPLPFRGMPSWPVRAYAQVPA